MLIVFAMENFFLVSVWLEEIALDVKDGVDTFALVAVDVIFVEFAVGVAIVAVAAAALLLCAAF